MVRVNVRTPPSAEQPAPAPPSLAAQRATTQFQVQETVVSSTVSRLDSHAVLW